MKAGLSGPSLTLDCFDVNPRVIGYFAGLSKRKSYELFYRWNPEDDEQRAFLPPEGRLEIGPALLARLRPIEANILTSRPEGTYDLIVATNVLLYFSGPELLLALANLQQSLKPGGFLLHNDLRPEMEGYGRALGLPPVHARMVRLSERRSLYDSVVIHRSAKVAASPLK